ncbi:MAG: tetratricopeptide repeat protein [Alphaproteobacteria bacterium]|nr:tetratricopeptide repeat protein [Alphaproteobacteria bacterium]MBU0794217.1 tetratricopeptide repeat protein [Alphaproteobacteria bacterium]MBU0876568.1 tetratricopeptide repeat protein [Alphaproteobacteria bacterium]MBU1769269.1 tetratricopeptide repeat protein [Alphaproteobacteria bacterium]
MATLGLSEKDKQAVEDFRRNVVDPSQTKLVLVDFWAEWCGPCKQLSPIIEKIAAEYADRGVLLVKINVDENRFIASQFRVQSIPTVYAVFQGQPVADLTQARTESQYRQMLDQILAQLPVESEAGQREQDIAPLLAMAEDVLASGDAARALSIFAQISEIAPDNAEAVGGQIRALVAAGELDEGEALIASLPEALAKDAAVERGRSAIALARTAKPGVDVAPLQARVQANPDDHEALFELSSAYMANGDRDAAAEALLTSIARDRSWEDGKARAQLLQLFEVVGLEDPWVAGQRRRLSQILFA